MERKRMRMEGLLSRTWALAPSDSRLDPLALELLEFVQYIDITTSRFPCQEQERSFIPENDCNMPPAPLYLKTLHQEGTRF